LYDLSADGQVQKLQQKMVKNKTLARITGFTGVLHHRQNTRHIDSYFSQFKEHATQKSANERPKIHANFKSCLNASKLCSLCIVLIKINCTPYQNCSVSSQQRTNI